MKTLSPLRFFFTSVIIYLIVAYLIHFKEYSNNVFPWTKLVEELGKDVFISLFLTFVHVIKQCRKTVSPENLKTARRRLIVYCFIVSWLSVEIFTVSEEMLFGGEISWAKTLLMGLILAMFQVGLVILFSGSIVRITKQTRQE
ncbi:MAG: hypothetical protein Q8904_08650 [Bacteroidota bacterium]|nr:hypothetical protein [Bacteroidota bacterium]